MKKKKKFNFHLEIPLLSIVVAVLLNKVGVINEAVSEQFIKYYNIASIVIAIVYAVVVFICFKLMTKDSSGDSTSAPVLYQPKEFDVLSLDLMTEEECEKYWHVIPQFFGSIETDEWWVIDKHGSPNAVIGDERKFVGKAGFIYMNQKRCVRPKALIAVKDNHSFYIGEQLNVYAVRWTVLDILDESILVICNSRIAGSVGSVYFFDDVRNVMDEWLDRKSNPEKFSHEPTGDISFLNLRKPKLTYKENGLQLVWIGHETKKGFFEFDRNKFQVKEGTAPPDVYLEAIINKITKAYDPDYRRIRNDNFHISFV